MKLIFLDIEVYPNYFLVVFYNPYTKQYMDFYLWEVEGVVQHNDIYKLEKYLKEEKDTFFVGYNSLGYDMNILTAIVDRKLRTNSEIKSFNDELINSEWPIYREEQLCNKTLDLMLVNNYGPRSAKSSSLKKLEFNLRKKKIADLPYHFNDLITTEKEVLEIIKYCKYDVEVTMDVYKMSRQLIEMRIEFGDLNGLDLLNSTEPDIAKKYMLKLLSQKLNKKESEIKKLKTYNEKLVVKDLILNYIKEYKFKNKVFIDLLEFYNSLEILATIKSAIYSDRKVITLKNKIEHSFDFINNKFVFGAGGGHSCQESDIFESNDEYVIIDSDVAALYPSLAIENEFYPKHLGISYCEILKENVERRKQYSKKEFPLINNSIKVSNNASYGMSNSEYSFFYDSSYTLKTCISGMLTLSMLIDMCVDEIKDFTLLQFNTDGVTVRIKNKDQDHYFSIINRLETISKLVFEHVYYKKMVIRDVNNYIAIDINNNIKTKGVFEDYSDIINAGAYHKDTSAMIIPKALKAYFVEGIPVYETINKENSIYEFCYGNKGSSSYRWLLTNYQDNGVSKSELFDSRFVRYFAGGTETLSQLWVKGKKAGQIQATQAQTPITLLMNVPKEDILDLDKKGEHKPRLNKDGEIIYRYPTLNRDWYINECLKIINNIQKETI